MELGDVRNDFPALSNTQRPVHYLDKAATMQKPWQVINRMTACYTPDYSPVHRGLYPLGDSASTLYEQSRQELAQFIGAGDAEQIVYTRSAPEAINLVAMGWARLRLRPGDELWVSRLEHHANFLPWQQLCRETGARLKIIELKSDGSLDIASAQGLFGPQTRLIALSMMSNVLGVINPVREIIDHAGEIPVLLDAAQFVAHNTVDVEQLQCDFLVFSAHKMAGPTGIGLLYAKTERLQEMEPLLLGGGMVDEVGANSSSWLPHPAKFEAGSPNLIGAVGFAAAATYLSDLGLSRVSAHAKTLQNQAMADLSNISGVTVYGANLKPAQRSAIVSFNLDGIHPHDVAHIASEAGVALRAGHHCCQPLMQALGVDATVRASFSIYNDRDDVNALIDVIMYT